MNSNLDDQKVLVLFPSSKNFPKAQKVDENVAQKALEELEERKEVRKQTTNSLPQHVDLNKKSNASVRMSLDELVEVVDNQLDVLKENNKRMKYYLDEIEFYWPESND